MKIRCCKGKVFDTPFVDDRNDVFQIPYDRVTECNDCPNLRVSDDGAFGMFFCEVRV